MSNILQHARILIPALLLFTFSCKQHETELNEEIEAEASLNRAAAEDRLAITRVIEELKSPFSAMNKAEQSVASVTNAEGAMIWFKKWAESTQQISEIDISKCPEDFRQAWYPFRDAAQNLTMNLSLIPALEGNNDMLIETMGKITENWSALVNAHTEVKVSAQKFGVIFPE